MGTGYTLFTISSLVPLGEGAGKLEARGGGYLVEYLFSFLFSLAGLGCVGNREYTHHTLTQKFKERDIERHTKRERLRDRKKETTFKKNTINEREKEVKGNT